MEIPNEEVDNFNQYEQDDIYEENLDIEEQQAKLDDLLDQIDESQVSVDNLREQIAEKQVEINHLTNEIMQLKKLKEKQTIEGNYGSQSTEFDISQLNQEHKDLVNEILDRIYSREMDLEKIEADNTNLNAEVDALMLENESILQQIRKCKSQIVRRKQDHQILRNDIQLTQKKIKELEQTIRMNNQTLNITSAAVTGLAERQDNFQNENGGSVELKKQITSTIVKIGLEEYELSQTNAQIEQMNDEHKDAMAKIEKELQAHNNLVKWDDEKNAINAEIKATMEALKQAKIDNESKNTNYNLLNKRYRLLVPIVKKWANKDLSKIEDDPDADIDSLVEQATKASASSLNDTENKNETLEQKIKENASLEASNARKRDELEREIQLFNAEEKRLKESIEFQRTRAFEEEHDIVTQISRIKVKIAQIKNKL